MNDYKSEPVPRAASGDTWCVVTDIEAGMGTVKYAYATYDEALAICEHPDEIWVRCDAPKPGTSIVRRGRGRP